MRLWQDRNLYTTNFRSFETDFIFWEVDEGFRFWNWPGYCTICKIVLAWNFKFWVPSEWNGNDDGSGQNEGAAATRMKWESNDIDAVGGRGCGSLGAWRRDVRRRMDDGRWRWNMMDRSSPRAPRGRAMMWVPSRSHKTFKKTLSTSQKLDTISHIFFSFLILVQNRHTPSIISSSVDFIFYLRPRPKRPYGIRDHGWVRLISVWC